MDHNRPSDSDAFDQILSELDRVPATRPELADSIFAQTRGVLTRRRWWRRGRLVVACLVCYAVGIGSGWLLKPGAPQLADQPQGKFILPSPPSQLKNLVPNTQDLKPNLAQTKTPAEAHPPAAKIAAPRGGSQFDNFRRAGDRQLFERGNIRGAMDCYRRALTHANEQQLRVEVDRDSWLLMSLKQSRLEERKHVRQKRV